MKMKVLKKESTYFFLNPNKQSRQLDVSQMLDSVKDVKIIFSWWKNDKEMSKEFNVGIPIKIQSVDHTYSANEVADKTCVFLTQKDHSFHRLNFLPKHKNFTNVNKN